MYPNKRTLVFLLAMLAVCGACRTVRAAPNVVIILVDDFGYGDLSRNGSVTPTPHLDRFFSDGVELTRFYTYPVCSPTRAALMAGRHPVLTGIAPHVVGRNGVGLGEGEITIAEAFNSAGYETAFIGKWHLGKKPHPNRHGFDLFYGSLDGVVDYFNHRFNGKLSWEENGVDVIEDGYVTTLLEQRAARILRQDRERPLFLLISTTAIHRPPQATDELLRQVPKSIRGKQKRSYAAMTIALDDLVGGVRRILEKEGMADETIVVFLSDNGPSKFRKSSSGPFRGNKHTLYDGGVRVPAAIIWPEHLRGGQTTDCLIATEDLHTTLLRLAGQQAITDAFDFSSCLPGFDEVVFSRARVASGMPEAHADRSLREYAYWLWTDADAIVGEGGRWKLIRRRNGIELYDLELDRAEATNINHENPDVVHTLLAELDRWEIEVGAAPSHVPLLGTFSASPNGDVVRIDARNAANANADARVRFSLSLNVRIDDRLEFDCRVEVISGTAESISFELNLVGKNGFFSKAGAVDQNGWGLSDGVVHEATDKWIRRVVSLGNGAPLRATSFEVRVHGKGQWRVWVDNLRIRRADGSSLEIYENGNPMVERVKAEDFDELSVQTVRPDTSAIQRIGN